MYKSNIDEIIVAVTFLSDSGGIKHPSPGKNEKRYKTFIDLPKRAEGGRLHAYSRVLSPDGSGPRPVPECTSPTPMNPEPVHAPPSARTLAPRHQPTDPKSIGNNLFFIN